MKGKIDIYFLFFTLFFSFLSYSSEQINLVRAVEQGEIQDVQKAMNIGENYNFVGVYNPDDYSSSDWSLLMKAIARLGSLLIEAQSFINTVDVSSKTVALPMGLISGIVSFLYAKKKLPTLPKTENSSFWKQLLSKAKQVIQSKYFIIPGIATGLLIVALQYGLLFKTGAFFKTNIENQYAIIQLLLNQQNINKEYQSRQGETAYSLSEKISALINSPHLSPPYAPRKPEKRYREMLGNITQQTRTDTQVQIQEIRENPYFGKKTEFEPIEQDKLPIVFDSGYDITFFGVEKFHPFDTTKYSKIARYIRQQFPARTFYTPTEISNDDLTLAHTQEYLTSLASPWKLGLLADLPFLGLFPASLAARMLLEPVKKAIGGTIKATELAEQYGFSINLSGGYHHAKSDAPVYGGFCIINDTGIAVKKLLEKNPQYKILIVDLDAHQGNGNTDVFKNEKNVAIFDMFNADTWPGDFAEMERINFLIPLKAKTKDEAYLETLKKHLPTAINQVKPDFIVYNAGTDVYEKDPIGELSLSADGIINRDKIVFSEAMNCNIPIMMVLSGGYHKDSAMIIGRSIENMLKNIIKIGQ